MEKELDNFAWDNSTESIDFFGEVEVNPTIKEKKPEKKETGADDNEEKLDITNPEEDENEDVFKDLENEESEEEQSQEDDEEEEEDNQEGKDSKSKSKTKPSKLDDTSVVSYLKEKGILDFELEEGEELDEVKAAEILEEKFEETIEAKLKDLMGDLPDTVKNLVKYTMNGGDVNQYLQSLIERPTQITKDLDLEDEKNQELVVRARLQMQGIDEDDINDQIEFLKEKEKLADTAEKYFDKLISDLEKEEEELVEKQKKAKKQAKENQVKFKKEIQSILEEKEGVKEIKFSRTDKKELPDYISAPSIELEDGRVLTPFYHDLFETLKDKEKTLLLAKLIKSDFDFSDIEKAVKTKETKDIKNNLRRTEEKSTSKGGSSQPKRLVDYFN